MRFFIEIFFALVVGGVVFMLVYVALMDTLVWSRKDRKDR